MSETLPLPGSRLPSKPRILRSQLVARQLPANKLIERHVVIECPDDKVPIVIGMRPIVILLKTKTLGKPRYIEPMPCPSLTKVGALKQPIDEPFIRIGRIIRNERLNLLGRRRQTGGNQEDPPAEGSAISRRIRHEAGRSLSGKDELIHDRTDWTIARCDNRDFRGSGLHERPKRPPIAHSVGNRRKPPIVGVLLGPCPTDDESAAWAAVMMSLESREQAKMPRRRDERADNR